MNRKYFNAYLVGSWLILSTALLLETNKIYRKSIVHQIFKMLLTKVAYEIKKKIGNLFKPLQY